MDDITGLVQKVNGADKSFKNDITDIENRLTRKKETREIEYFNAILNILENKYEQTKAIIEEVAAPDSPQKNIIIDEVEADILVAERYLTIYPFYPEEPHNDVLTALTALANANICE